VITHPYRKDVSLSLAVFKKFVWDEGKLVAMEVFRVDANGLEDAHMILLPGDHMTVRIAVSGDVHPLSRWRQLWLRLRALFTRRIR
jgi:hypothetical protein